MKTLQHTQRNQQCEIHISVCIAIHNTHNDSDCIHYHFIIEHAVYACVSNNSELTEVPDSQIVMRTV
jgi:hypothetical protein